MGTPPAGARRDGPPLDERAQPRTPAKTTMELPQQQLLVDVAGVVWWQRVAAVAGLVAVATVGLRTGRSWFSAAELGALIAADLLQLAGRTSLWFSFPSFLLAKLLAATAVFLAEISFRTDGRRQLPIAYALGSGSGALHTDVVVAGKAYCLALSHEDANGCPDGRYSAYRLQAHVEPRPPRPMIEHAVGVVCLIGSEEDALQRVARPGHQHDCAGLLVGVVSADEFMRYSLRSWLRVLNCFALFLFAILLVVSLEFARAVMETTCVACALFDVLLARVQQPQHSAAASGAQLRLRTTTTTAEALKLALHLLLLVALARLSPAAITITAWELSIYLATTAALSHVVDRAIRCRWPILHEQ